MPRIRKMMKRTVIGVLWVAIAAVGCRPNGDHTGQAATTQSVQPAPPAPQERRTACEKVAAARQR